MPRASADREPEAQDALRSRQKRLIRMLDVCSSRNDRPGWLALSLPSLLVAVAGCGGTVKAEVPCPMQSDLVQASGAVQVGGGMRNAALVGRSLASVGSANDIAKTSVNNGFGPLERCGPPQPPVKEGPK